MPTKEELLEAAKAEGIAGASGMTKAELEEALGGPAALTDEGDPEAMLMGELGPLGVTTTVQPTTPVDGSTTSTMAGKLAVYTWKPFVPPSPAFTGSALVDGDQVTSTLTTTGPIATRRKALTGSP